MKSTAKMRELREKAPGDLVLREKELAEQLFALRLQKVTGQLEKPSKIQGARREMARVLTVAGEKQRGVTVTPKQPVARKAAAEAPPAEKAGASKSAAKKPAAKKTAKGAAR